MKRVKVVWDDCGDIPTNDKAEDGVWGTKAEVLKQYGEINHIVSTYGVLVYENKKDLIVAQSFLRGEKKQEPLFSFCTKIPKVLIVEIIELEEK